MLYSVIPLKRTPSVRRFCPSYGVVCFKALLTQDMIQTSFKRFLNVLWTLKQRCVFTWRDSFNDILTYTNQGKRSVLQRCPLYYRDLFQQILANINQFIPRTTEKKLKKLEISSQVQTLKDVHNNLPPTHQTWIQSITQR